MQQRRKWAGPGLIFALVLAWGGLVPADRARGAETAAKVKLGVGPAYDELGLLPMMHAGRVKPLDTVARGEIKILSGREEIKLTSDDGKTTTTWGPVAAFLDFAVRPDFWNDQPIIAVEYLPLKRFVLRGMIREELGAIASRSATAAADRERINAVIARDEIDSAALRSLLAPASLGADDARTVERLAAKVGEETRCLTPNDLQTAEVEVAGKPVRFTDWLARLGQSGDEAGPMAGGRPKLTDIEQKGGQVGANLAKYIAIRDRRAFDEFDLLITPHPANPTALKFAGDSYQKAIEAGPDGLQPMEREAAETLNKYYYDIPSNDRKPLGSDAEFDQRYTRWLREKAAWVPLKVIREVEVEDLNRAGFPSKEVEAFRTAWAQLDAAEAASPGQVDDAPATALIAAARDLGRSINRDLYPPASAMARETHYNRVAPFQSAPAVYFLATLLLALSLIGRSDVAVSRSSGLSWLKTGLYAGGMTLYGLGIGLEAYGFALRVLISGWAPVSNMYETMIWVPLVLSVIGLVLEVIYRRTYAALGGSMAAMLGTFLAATAPMLDSKIPQLPPVLRSNYWLMIHVLTIVSSYGAFALAWALGMIGTTFYLTATYRRSPSPLALLFPVVPGLLLGVPGYLGTTMLAGKLSSSVAVDRFGLYASYGILALGIILTGTGVFAFLGELVNRLRFREAGPGSNPARASVEPPPVTSLIEAEAARIASGGDFAPPSAKPSATTTATTTSVDRRGEAMRATAAEVKPIASFIYRAMQVGVLLVAAGTFLGGWWADVSWGRFWGWDPKEVWALITLLVYLIPLHGRFAGWVNTFWLTMSSIACFLSVVMAWYGVNFVLGVGLHAYAFAEAGGQGAVGLGTTLVLSYATGTAWRRHLGQMV